MLDPFASKLVARSRTLVDAILTVTDLLVVDPTVPTIQVKSAEYPTTHEAVPLHLYTIVDTNAVTVNVDLLGYRTVGYRVADELTNRLLKVAVLEHNANVFRRNLFYVVEEDYRQDDKVKYFFHVQDPKMIDRLSPAEASLRALPSGDVNIQVRNDINELRGAKYDLLQLGPHTKLVGLVRDSTTFVVDFQHHPEQTNVYGRSSTGTWALVHSGPVEAGLVSLLKSLTDNPPTPGSVRPSHLPHRLRTSPDPGDGPEDRVRDLEEEGDPAVAREPREAPTPVDYTKEEAPPADRGTLKKDALRVPRGGSAKSAIRRGPIVPGATPRPPTATAGPSDSDDTLLLLQLASVPVLKVCAQFAQVFWVVARTATSN